jgi:multidrug efflux system outer membrane protein
MRYCCVAFAAAVLLSGCAVGPNYKRPEVPVPVQFRTPEQLSEREAASLADLKWFEVFHDEALQELIRGALQQNYDLRDAFTRVEQARANLGVTRANQLPQLSASGSLEATRISRNGSLPIPSAIPVKQDINFGQAGLNLLSFELDIWGRLRRAIEAARASLLSAQENRKAVITTVVSDVASDYLHLRELDHELEISQRTLENREAFLKLTQDRQRGGVATLLDLRQAEQLVETAAARIPTIQQQIEQMENAISLLLAENPRSIVRGRSFLEQDLPPDVPFGMPSNLLERRPDIRAAEQALVAANANIGVAKAAYFPQISLSGLIGGQSSQLTSLFSGPNGNWTFAPQITQPIFAGGRIKSNVRLAEAQRNQAEVAYEKAIQTAFREVSDALIAHQRTHQSRHEQEKLVSALEDRKRLAYVRYRGGVDTQLNALDADRDLFAAELTLAQTRYSELLSVVQLYKALGGGWQ